MHVTSTWIYILILLCTHSSLVKSALLPRSTTEQTMVEFYVLSKMPKYLQKKKKKKEKLGEWETSDVWSVRPVGWQFLQPQGHQNFPISIIRVWRTERFFWRCQGISVSYMTKKTWGSQSTQNIMSCWWCALSLLMDLDKSLMGSAPQTLETISGRVEVFFLNLMNGHWGWPLTIH